MDHTFTMNESLIKEFEIPSTYVTIIYQQPK